MTNAINWDEKIEYLRESRKDMWNLDYLEFLVTRVWKLDKPVRVMDFGCGMGWLGSVLLPLLPKGSSYTGLDGSAHLLEQARVAFKDSGWSTEFLEQDLTHCEPIQCYDIAICQAVLIHMPNPKLILEKMVSSVVEGGRVICIEPNWAYTYFGVYRHGTEKYQYSDWGIQQKIFDGFIQRGERDPYIGLKIPALMNDLGLKNIDIRINEKANFKLEDSNKERLSKDVAERRSSNPFYNPETYVKQGLTLDEAQRHVEGIIQTEDYTINNKSPVVSAMAYLISYGEK